jgi:trimeric autotransporter adhesin
MQGFNKLALALAVTATITACGGGGGSSNDTPVTTPPPAQQGPTVSGTANKGIIANAQVQVFEVLADGTLSAEPVGETTTDASGDYEVTLSEDYAGGPLKVVVSAIDGSTMICDAPTGCGTVAFGQPYTLAAGFELSAVLPEAEGDTVSVHVTPLTDMAAKRAEQADTLDAAAIANANDVVRQTFGLSGDITQIEPIDATDPAAMAAADETSQQAALLSAGILEAVLKTDAVTGETATLEEALSNFSDSYATDGGLVTNDTEASEGAIVSLDDILEETGNVVAQVELAAAEEHIDLDIDDVSALIDLQLSDAQDEPESDDPDDSIEPIDTVLADRVTKAKALITDLRDLGTAANLASIETAADTFGGQIEAAFSDTEMVDEINDEATAAAEALGLATEALGEAFAAYSDDNTVTSYTLPADAEDGTPAVDVSIAPVEADNDINVTLSVDQDINDVAVVLDATANFTEEETESDFDPGLEELSFFYDATLAISGSASNDEFSLSINDGSLIDIQFDGEEFWYDAGDWVNYEETEELNVANLDITLNVTLAQLTGDNPVEFSGTMELGLSEWRSFYGELSQSDDPDFSCFSEVGQFSFPCDGDLELLDTVTLSEASFSLSGEFSDQQNNSLNASFTINLDNENGYVDRWSFEDHWDYSAEPWVESNPQETESEETAENYVGVGIILSLTAELPGIDTTTLMQLTADRTGLEDATSTLRLEFNGKVITLDIDTADATLNIENQDAVVVALAEDEEGFVGGTITVDGEAAATVEESDNGLVVIRYTDGSVNSLQ